MKVIICGAGQVGTNIARYLTDEGNDVTVIDIDPEMIQTVGDSLDVRALIGHASHPDVLERAGAESADLLIAVTFSDEVNMVACQIAHSIFNVRTKISRIRNQSYMDPIYAGLFNRDQLPIDHIISPEIEVAHAIINRLEVPGAFDMVPLAGGLLRLLGVVLSDTCPILNTPLKQLTEIFPELALEITLIIRDDKSFIPTCDDQLFEGDQVYFVVDKDHVSRAMAAFGYEEKEANRVLLLGGGNIGLFVAKEIEKKHSGVTLRIIEHNHKRAEYIAQQLTKATILHGDVLDSDILEEAHVANTETVVALTNDDESNILSSLLAKRFGAKRAVTLVNKTTYTSFISTLGVDAVVNPRSSTVSSILQHVRGSNIKAAYSLREGFAEVMEGRVLDTSALANNAIRELKLPVGVIIGAVVRDGEAMIARPDVVIEVGDLVIVFAKVKQAKAAKSLFDVGLEFF